jgi:hypothetical protein
MSLLPAEVQGALAQLLQALASPDNTLRSQAEDQLNNDWTANRPDVLLMALVEQMLAAEDPAVCEIIPAILHMLISKHYTDTVVRCSLVPQTILSVAKNPDW